MYAQELENSFRAVNAAFQTPSAEVSPALSAVPNAGNRLSELA